MRAIKEWMAVHPNYYLDRRRAEWRAEEREGWVRYQPCAESPVVFVHQGQAARIVDALDVGLLARQCDPVTSAAILASVGHGVPPVADTVAIDTADTSPKEGSDKT